MRTPRFDRTKLLIKPLSARVSKTGIAEIAIRPDARVPALPEEVQEPLARLTAQVIRARQAGRPVMVTKNDYPLRLFNGDMGITLPDPDGNQELRVFFPSADGEVRKFPPLRLPEHETVYALTVHKSQGSEFDRVLLILPDRDAPVLTRELIYTGITRAREQVEIWGEETTFCRALSRRIQRSSGLREALWGADGIDG